jgi:hypothetical protein
MGIMLGIYTFSGIPIPFHDKGSLHVMNNADAGLNMSVFSQSLPKCLSPLTTLSQAINP